jgi:hypothetical protein
VPFLRLIGTVDLQNVVSEIANAIAHVDKSRVPFRGFQPGVGPYGEPQLVKLISLYLNQLPSLSGTVRTKRTPDLLIENEWAMEFKIVRPYGDNDREAEDWSVNSPPLSRQREHHRGLLEAAES